MTAPVNPEGQTARGEEWNEAIRAAALIVQSSTLLHEDKRKNLSGQILSLLAPAQPSEGQTAQEVRRALKAVLRVALRSRRECARVWQAHGGEEGSPPYLMDVPADELTRQALRYSGSGGADAAEGIALEVLKLLRALVSTPSPAKQEQKIASAEGTASRLGAAPVIMCQFCEHAPHPNSNCAVCGCWRYGDGLDVPVAAPAQPDARDAEIARLREAVEAENLGAKAEQGRLAAENARLTKELEEARAAHQETRDERDTIKDEFDQLALAHYGSEAKALLEALRDLFWDNFPRGVLITRAVCTAPEWRAYQLLAPPEPKAETPAETGRSIQFEGPAGGTGHPLIDQGRDARKPDGREPDASGAVGLPPCGEQQDSRSAGPSVSETAGQKEGL